MLGVLTGVGGGIARDILVAEIPTVLRAELYAVAALAGATVVVLAECCNSHMPVAIAGRRLVLWTSLHGDPLRLASADRLPVGSTTSMGAPHPHNDGRQGQRAISVRLTIMPKNHEPTNCRRTSYRGSDKLILGIVLAVITFWLFAQTTLNIAPTMRDELRISESLNNIAVSITALFSGIFIVVAGSLADRLGRMKITYVGLALGILGSLLIALSPSGTAVFLMAGRIIQGLSAACIMPATLALIKPTSTAGRASARSASGPSAHGAAQVFALFRRLGRFLSRLALDFLDVDPCRGRRFSSSKALQKARKPRKKVSRSTGPASSHSSLPWWL